MLCALVAVLCVVVATLRAFGAQIEMKPFCDTLDSLLLESSRIIGHPFTHLSQLNSSRSAAFGTFSVKRGCNLAPRTLDLVLSIAVSMHLQCQDIEKYLEVAFEYTFIVHLLLVELGLCIFGSTHGLLDPSIQAACRTPRRIQSEEKFFWDLEPTSPEVRA